MMLQIIPGFQNRRVHLLHRVPQFDPELIKNILLPLIVLGIHPSLHLLIINHAYAKRFLRLGSVER